jgi:hypothetical protein
VNVSGIFSDFKIHKNTFQKSCQKNKEETMKLLDHVKQVIRKKHYSYKTEEAYASWIKRFILFHNKTHPAQMSETEIASFITDLAVNGNVTAST